MFSKILHFARQKPGFTLIETLVSISVFLIIIAMATGIFSDSFASQRKAEVSKIVYEETRIALERIVKEVRRGTIDYEEYFSHIRLGSTDYAENYGEYAAKFYTDCSSGSCLIDLNASDIDRFCENIGENTSGEAALEQHAQEELYLITADGTEKTIIKLIPESMGATTEAHIEMLKLPGRDSDNDGQVDDWKIYGAASLNPSPSVFYDYCVGFDAGGNCNGVQFQKIQPDSIQITSLKFFIAPLEDPRKAFAEFTNDIQQQPHAIIQITAEPSADRARGVRGEIPSIKLQTTIGARAQNEVKSLN